MIAAALAGASRLLCGPSIQWHCDPSAATQRIYFGNHSSHLDFVMIWSALPPRLRNLTRPVAGRDYWDRSALRRYLAGQVFRAVLIERGRGRSSGDDAAAARASIERMAAEMAGRYSLIVFPEGTRSLDGQVAPFKSGLYHLSRKRPDLELMPVYIDNLNRVLPRGEFLPVPLLSSITIGPPIWLEPKENKHDFLKRARDAVRKLKDV